MTWKQEIVNPHTWEDINEHNNAYAKLRNELINKQPKVNNGVLQIYGG